MSRRDAEAPTRRSVLGGVSAMLVALTAKPASAETTPAGPPDAIRLLRAVPGKAKIYPEAAEAADIWAFDGGLPAPILRVRLGETFKLRLTNETPSPLALHWHGLRGPNAMDGVAGLTQPPIPPGGQFDYSFAPPDAGTFLVRPLVPGRAGEAAGRGLSALLVVEEREPPKLDGDYALVVRDWRVTPAGTLEPFGQTESAAYAGRLGNRIDVAGFPAPNRLELAPGARIRLRLANAANARIMRIRFDNLKAYVAAIDGQPTETFEPLRATLPFAPGSRYDLFIDAPEPGAKGTITALIGAGVALAEISTKAGTAATTAPLVALRPNTLLPAEIRLQNAVRKDVVIEGGATRGPNGEPVFNGDLRAIWRVNGAPGSAEAPPLLKASRGVPVVLVFRLLHGLDDGWEPYWLDTFQVPEGKTLRIAFMADNPGKWMLGSTVLERLDTGLWTWLEVA
jgi:FtsP/CotA-like multicopper oxidase with cupredoxin domain